MNDDRLIILADTHYALRLGSRCKPLDEAIKQAFGRLALRVSRRSGLLRAMMAMWIGRNFDLVVTAYGVTGAKWIVLLAALCWRSRGRIMLLQFIAPEKSGLRRIIYRAWIKFLFAPALRRAVGAFQAMTSWEIDEYARQFQIPPERFRHIPWPLLDDAANPFPDGARANHGVMSSGRAACDWQTLFGAAQGADWPLTVVCGRADLQRVQRLSKTRPAQIFCDVPVEEHERLVRSSAVYVLCLREHSGSSGQIRMMNAISAGVPVVATWVKGLEGYAVDETTALVVKPGDPNALRVAINRLLSDPSEARDLCQKALEFARSRTTSDYYRMIAEAVWQAAQQAASGTPHLRGVSDSSSRPTRQT